MPTLRPYQAAQRAAALSHFAAGARAVLIQGPTGSGKTVTGVDTALRLAAGQPVVWVAHREELALQAQAAVWTAGVDATLGVPLTGAQVRCTSIQRLLHTDVPPAAVYVLDEARHYVAPEWTRPVQDMLLHGRLLGLDATPSRADGIPLSNVFERLVHGPQVRELIAAGRLVPAYHLAPSEPCDALAIDPVDGYLEHCAGQSAVWFLDSVAEAQRCAERLTERFGGAALAEVVHASSKDRAEIFERFATGETLVLCNVGIVTEGVDLPGCEAVGVFCGVGSAASWLQRLGRGGRPAPGKRRFTVLDALGHCWRHVGWSDGGESVELGFFDDDRTWDLSGSPMNGAARPSERMPVQCPGRRADGTLCGAWQHPPRCEVCGAQLGSSAKRRRPRRVKPQPMTEARREMVAQKAQGPNGYLAQWVAENMPRLIGLPPKAKNRLFASQIHRYMPGGGARTKAGFRVCWDTYNKLRGDT